MPIKLSAISCDKQNNFTQREGTGSLVRSAQAIHARRQTLEVEPAMSNAKTCLQLRRPLTKYSGAHLAAAGG